MKKLPTLRQSICSLGDADNKTIKRKFYQTELQLIRLPLEENVI